MSPELDKELAALAHQLGQAGTDALAFFTTHAPETVEQLLRWRMVENLVGVGVAVTVCAGLVKLCRLTKAKIADPTSRWDSDSWVPVGIITGCFGIPAVLCGGEALMNALKVIFAPNAALLDIISKLAK